MAEDHLAVVRAVHDAASRGDTAALLELYAPDVVWDISNGPLAQLAGAAVYEGHDGLRSFFRSWREALDDAEYLLDELVVVGRDVVSVGRLRGRGRASGLLLEGAEQAAVWTVRDGRVARVVWFGSRHAALAAAA